MHLKSVEDCPLIYYPGDILSALAFYAATQDNYRRMQAAWHIGKRSPVEPVSLA